MVRKGLIVVILFGSVIFLAYYISRPKPLRPIIVTWQEVGKVLGFVDLDADGNDELIVRDRSRQFWWVQFRLPTPIRQKIPAPKDAEFFYRPRGQMLALWHSKTRQALLITRQGEKWAMKDLGRLDSIKVKDADRDGQVNDVVVWHGQTRKVFSRMRDGTIIERPNLPDFQADFDGDGKEDLVYMVRQEVLVRFSSGQKASLKLPRYTPIAIADMDGDKMAEIVGVEWIGRDRRFHCWRYENERWRKSSSPIFVGGRIIWHKIVGDPLSGISPEGGIALFRDEKGAYLLAVTGEGKGVKVWEVRWREGKWTKRLMGEVPEELVSSLFLIVFVRVGQGWIVIGDISPSKWQDWLWGKVGQYLRRFLPFLQEPQRNLFVYGWDGQRRLTFLGRGRWNILGPHPSFSLDGQLADMDGDREREFTIAFPERVLVAKFEDGRWRTGWLELSFVVYVPMYYPSGISYGFRYGGQEWALYQEVGNNRCVAIALEGRQ